MGVWHHSWGLSHPLLWQGYNSWSQFLGVRCQWARKNSDGLIKELIVVDLDVMKGKVFLANRQLVCNLIDVYTWEWMACEVTSMFGVLQCVTMTVSRGKDKRSKMWQKIKIPSGNVLEYPVIFWAWVKQFDESQEHMSNLGGWGQLLYLIPRGSCNIFDVLVQWSSIPRFAPNAPCCWYGANLMCSAIGTAPAALCSLLRRSLTITAVTDISYICMGDEFTLIHRRALVNKYGVFKRLKNRFYSLFHVVMTPTNQMLDGHLFL